MAIAESMGLFLLTGDGTLVNGSRAFTKVTTSLTLLLQPTRRRLHAALSVVVVGFLAVLVIAPRLFLHQPFLGPVPVAGWIPVPCLRLPLFP